MDTRLNSIITNQITIGPETVHIDITNLCNLNCLYCWNYSPLINKKSLDEFKQQKIEYDLFESALDDLKSLGTEKIIFSGGGEPFTHPYIYEFISSVKQRGMELSILTNLTLADPLKLMNLGVDRIFVNISAGSEETYKKLHPNSSNKNFRRIKEKLKELKRNSSISHLFFKEREIKEMSLKHRVKITLVQVINSENYNELPLMIELADEVRANQVSFKLISIENGTSHLAVNNKQKDELINKIIPETSKLSDDKKIKTNLSVFLSQLENNKNVIPIEKIGCYVGYFYSRVYLDGRVFFCCKHFEVGNLYKDSFKEIWFSERYNEFRKRMREKKFFPQCVQCGKYDLNFQIANKLKSL